jgi:hypothetical protein
MQVDSRAHQLGSKRDVGLNGEVDPQITIAEAHCQRSPALSASHSEIANGLFQVEPFGMERSDPFMCGSDQPKSDWC